VAYPCFVLVMKRAVFISIFSILLIFNCHCSLSQQMALNLVVGTYTNAQPDTGIYIFSFDTLSGTLVKKAWGKELVNPSFLCVHPKSKVIYACTDTKLPRFGSVTGIELVQGAKQLKVLNKQGSEGENPVYIKTLDRWVFNVNYNEGNLAVLEIQDDKTLKPYVQKIQFQGKSIHPKRQELAHPHSIYFSKDKRFALVPDLGSDLIRVFEFNSMSAQPLLERTDLNFKSPAGSGPRHLAFHPNGKWVYCIEELSGTVSYFTFKRGKLKPVQRLSTYSSSLEEYSGADIHCSPDGKFLYCSNRIENSLAIFKIDRKKGDLSLVGHQKTMGETPRNFTIDPFGKFLIVANQGSSSLVVFKRNPFNGKLTQMGNPIDVSRPSCLDWIQIY